MEVAVEVVAVALPSQKALDGNFAILLQEKGGTRRAVIGFARDHFRYLVTAFNDALVRSSKPVLHVFMAELLDRAGITVEQLAIHHKPAGGGFIGTLTVRHGTHSWTQSSSLVDALGLASVARARIVMDDAQLEETEREYAEIQDRFVFVDHIGDIPLKLAEHHAAKGSTKLTQN